MNKTSLIAILLVSGCANVVPYDPVQFNTAVDMVVLTNVLEKECGNAQNARTVSALMFNKADNLYVSSKYRSDIAISQAAAQLKEFTKELQNSYDGTTPSKEYCLLKAQLIRTEAEHILMTMGRKEQ
jgi:hypothetical protein